MKQEQISKLIHKDTKNGGKLFAHPHCPHFNHTQTHTYLRREGDSNPRIPYEINGFRDRPIRPLWHLSESGVGLCLSLCVGFGHGLGLKYLAHTHTAHTSITPKPTPTCGERGIRTPGPLQVNGFQDRRNRPLCHLSRGKSTKYLKRGKTCSECKLPDLWFYDC